MPKRRSWPPPRPASMRGVFTRSRSEIFVHRTRSGHARPDPARRRSHHTPSPSAASGDDGGAFSASVKDLRARRVFSPASVPPDCSPDQAVKTMSDGDPTDIINQAQRDVIEGKRSEQALKNDGGDVGFGTKSTDIDASGTKSADQVVKGGGLCQPQMDSSCLSESRTVAISLNHEEGLVPCSRLKLLGNPSSFSYRRLLPFLMDLKKDGSSGMEIIPCENYPVKMERKMRESPLPQKVDPSSKQKHQDSLPVEPREKPDNSERPICKSSILRPPEDAAPDMTEITTPCIDRADVRKATSEDSPEHVIFEPDLLYNSTYHPPSAQVTLSVEELAGDVQVVSYLRGKAEEKAIVPTLDIDMKPSLGRAPFRAFQALGKHALAPKKGILKKNTRGCRALCMCVDCVSFRIHAERAFEFSRKQMQEADEVVMGLIKELSCLRDLVENFIVPINNGVEKSSILHVNQEQVKRFCRRAFRAEDMARNRMKQMIHDLNNHCRIPGPKVTFAEYVEERMIP